MAITWTNVTLTLPIFLGGTLNRPELKFLQVEDDTRPNLLTLTGNQIIVLQTVIGANFLAGNLFRCLLFKQLWNNGRHRNPVNIMIGNFCVCMTEVCGTKF